MYELGMRPRSFISGNNCFKFSFALCTLNHRGLHTNIGIRRCVDHTFSSYKYISINHTFFTFLSLFTIFFFSGYVVGEWLEEDPLSPFLNSLVFSQHRVCSLQGRPITLNLFLIIFFLSNRTDGTRFFFYSDPNLGS
jgi:hypothetical protein